MASVGFMLPSNREEKALRTAKYINSIETEHDVTIYIYSPNEMKGENIVWFKEEEPGNGANKPFDYLATHAETDYIISIADDNYVSRNVYSVIDILNGEEFEDRQVKLLTINGTDLLPAWLPPPYNHIKVARHPAFHRSALDYLNGHLYNPSYNHHYNDNWLSYYIEHKYGEIIYEVKNVYMELVEPLSNGGYHPEDGYTFFRMVNKFNTEGCEYDILI